MIIINIFFRKFFSKWIKAIMNLNLARRFLLWAKTKISYQRCFHFFGMHTTQLARALLQQIVFFLVLFKIKQKKNKKIFVFLFVNRVVSDFRVWLIAILVMISFPSAKTKPNTEQFSILSVWSFCWANFFRSLFPNWYWTHTSKPKNNKR